MRVGGRTGLVAILGAVTLSVVAVGAGGTARAAGSPNRYRADDYADGQAMYVLPPGENGLVNATDALQFETTGKRPAASDDQLSQYANLLYGAPNLTNAKLTNYFNDESFGVKPEDVTAPRLPARASRSTATSTTSRTSTATPTPCGVRCRLRAGRGPAVHDGRAAPLRRRHAGVVPRCVLRLRADGPRPAAARAVHPGPGAGAGRRPAQAVRPRRCAGEADDRRVRRRA